MKRSSGASLDVFDFKEDDEVPESVSWKWKFKKSKNPKLDSSPSTKYQFLECFAGSAKLQSRGKDDVKPADIVTIDEDSHCSSDTSNPLGTPVEGSANDVLRGSHVISGNTDVQRSNHNLIDGEIGVGSPKDPSIENCHTSSTVLENQLVDDGSSDAGDSTDESSPCTSDSVPMENNGPVDGEIQDHWYNDFEMKSEMEPAVTLPTDYIFYRDQYYPLSLMIFSRSSIKMKDSSVYQDAKTYLSSWDVDDIVNVHCQWSSRSKLATVRLNLLPKDVLPADKVQGVSGIDELEFVVYDPDWHQRQESIMSLHQKYEAAWNNTGFNCGSNEEVLPDKRRELYLAPYLPEFQESFEDVVYPEGDPDAVSISKRDVDLLRPETFINDTIIDFYIKYLKNKIPLERRQSYHFFNSFFFRKLADLDKNPSSAFDGKAAFQRVRKWTRKIDLFEKDYIFIPVNYNLHWSLIVICHAGEVAKDEDMKTSLRVPCILHMDSIRGSHSGLKDLVQSYLREEWKERHKGTSEDDSSTFLNLRFISLELPQQENCYDCGLFLLHYVELFLAKAPENFSPFQITKFSNFLNVDWFMPAEVSLKRAQIQRLIHELLGNRSPGSAPSSYSDEVHTSYALYHGGNDHGTEFISGICNPANVIQQMGGMAMVGVSSSRTSQCLSEPGFQLVEPRSSSGSTFRQYEQYDLGTHCAQGVGAMPTIEEEAEANEDIIYSPEDIGAGISLRMDGFQLDGCSTTYPSSYLGPVKSQEPVVTDLVENKVSSSPSSGYESDDSEELIMFGTHLNSACYQNNMECKESEHFSDPTEHIHDFYRSKMNLNEHENLEQSQCSPRIDVSAPLEYNDNSSKVRHHCLDDPQIKSVEDMSGESTFVRPEDDLDLSKFSSSKNVPDLVKRQGGSSGVLNTVFGDSAEELDEESSKDKILLHQVEKNDRSRCSSKLAVSVQCDPGSSATPVSGSEMNGVEISDPSENVDQLNGEAIDSAPESFVSASSEMFETPTDVSPELDIKHRKADQDLPVEATILQPSHEEANIDDSQKGRCAGIHLVVDDSYSGCVGEQFVKKMQLSPPSHVEVLQETPTHDYLELDKMHGNADQDPPVQATMQQPTHEETSNDDSQKGRHVDSLLVVDDSSSDCGEKQDAQKMQLSPFILGEVTVETPTDGNQESDKRQGNPDQVLPVEATVLPTHEEANIDDSEKGTCVGSLWVADDSSSDFDEEQAAKKMQPSPPTHDSPLQETMAQLSQVEPKIDERQTGTGDNHVVDDSSSDSDDEHAAKRMRLRPPAQGEGSVMRT